MQLNVNSYLLIDRDLAYFSLPRADEDDLFSFPYDAALYNACAVDKSCWDTDKPVLISWLAAPPTTPPAKLDLLGLRWYRWDFGEGWEEFLKI